MSKPFIVYYNPTKDPAGWHRYMPENEQVDEGASDMKKFTLKELKTLVQANQRTLCHVSDYLSLAVKITPDPSFLRPMECQTYLDPSGRLPIRKTEIGTHESLAIAALMGGYLSVNVICKNHVNDNVSIKTNEKAIVAYLYNLSLPTSGIKAVKRVTTLGLIHGLPPSNEVIGAA